MFFEKKAVNVPVFFFLKEIIAIFALKLTDACLHGTVK